MHNSALSSYRSTNQVYYNINNALLFFIETPILFSDYLSLADKHDTKTLGADARSRHD
jgi:hypothetical protein